MGELYGAQGTPPPRSKASLGFVPFLERPKSAAKEKKTNAGFAGPTPGSILSSETTHPGTKSALIRHHRTDFRSCRDHHRPKGLILAWGPIKPKGAHLRPERTNSRAEKSTLGYRGPSIGPN